MLELRKPLLDLLKLVDDDDVGLLGVDPYRAVFAGDQLFDLTVFRCANLWIHVGNDTRDPHNRLELAEREAIQRWRGATFSLASLSWPIVYQFQNPSRCLENECVLKCISTDQPST